MKKAMLWFAVLGLLVVSAAGPDKNFAAVHHRAK